MNIGLEPYEWPPALQQRIAWMPRSEGARRRLLAVIERRQRFRGLAGIRLSSGLDPFARSTRLYSGLLPLELAWARPNRANSAPALIRVEWSLNYRFLERGRTTDHIGVGVANVPPSRIEPRPMMLPRLLALPTMPRWVATPGEARHSPNPDTGNFSRGFTVHSPQPTPIWPGNRLPSQSPLHTEARARTLPGKAPEPVLASRAAFQTGTASSAMLILPSTVGWIRRVLGKSAGVSQRLTRAVTLQGQGLPDRGPSGGLRRAESPVVKSTFEVGAPNPPYAGRTFQAKTSIAAAASPSRETPRPMASGVHEPALVLRRRDPAGGQASPTSPGGIPDQRALAGSSLVDALFDRALRQQAVPGIDLRLAPPPASALGSAQAGPESGAAAGRYRMTGPAATSSHPAGLSRGEINRVADEVARVLKRRERLENERRGAY